MHLQLLAVFFCLTFFRFLFKKAKEYTLISKIPSPPGFPLIGQTFHFNDNEDFVRKLYKWSGQFGSRFKIQIGLKSHIILSSPKDVQLILSTHTTVDKGKDYEYFWPWIGITVLTSAGKKWEIKRSMMEAAFHPKTLDANNYLEVMNEQVEKLVRVLSKKPEPKMMNLISEKQIYSTVLKIIMEITLGLHISGRKRTEYEEANIRLKVLVNHRRFRPWLYPSICWRLSPSGREESRCLKVIQDVIDNVVKRKKDERKKADTIQRKRKKHDDYVAQKTEQMKTQRGVLDHLLEWQETAKAPNTVSDYDMRDEINSLVFAGYEPTAFCILKALDLIGRDVSVQEKLRDELNEIVSAKKEKTTTTCFTFKDLDKMKYLEMCIKETLRLFPSVPTIGRDVYSDFSLDDQSVLPAGVSVTLLVNKMHRDPSIFPEPDKFIPGRFFQKNIQSEFDNSFMSFSFGNRGCLGKHLAMTISKVVIGKILTKFDVKTTSEGGNPNECSYLISPLLTKCPSIVELIPRQ